MVRTVSRKTASAVRREHLRNGLSNRKNSKRLATRKYANTSHKLLFNATPVDNVASALIGQPRRRMHYLMTVELNIET